MRAELRLPVSIAAATFAAALLLAPATANAAALERNDPLLRTGMEDASCGNSVVQDFEQCDDGNQVDGDTCASNCQIALCGNTFVEPGEECDDANTSPGDGCTGPVVCEIERGFACIGQPSICTTLCGDGVVAGAETCDDANTVNADGCDQTCATESGFTCFGMPSVCMTTCGDGVIAGAETCDDGNAANGDGCNSTCAVDPGFMCNGMPSVCSTICGDGVIVGAETCDDGNATNGDGCNSTCAIDPGFMCNGMPSVCTAVCGDGIIAGAETCDDGNVNGGDGCSSMCAIDPGFMCNGRPSVCSTICGDGIIAGTETCDDGNATNGDGCSSMCAIDPGYMCIGMPSVCSTVCGDGIIAGAETCDDGNTIGGDGCSAMCQLEPPTPDVTGSDYGVAAHGGQLVLAGSRFTGATSVTIGGVAQTFTVQSDTQLTVAVADNAPIGPQNLVVSNAAGPSGPFGMTVIRLLVNELDADQAGTDAAEFVEIATGVPNANLTGYVLTFWNGSVDLSYLSIHLAATTNADGLLVVGNAGVVPTPALTFAGNTLQNGQDAVSIHQTSLPHANGTPVTAAALIDALVYDTADLDDPGLLDTLLGVGPQRVQVDEGASPTSETQSIQRCEGAHRLDGRSFAASISLSPGTANVLAPCPF